MPIRCEGGFPGETDQSGSLGEDVLKKEKTQS
jgi:hypothetical protein